MKQHATTTLIVITAVFASLLEIIDMSIVNVALPHMQGNLGATMTEITWVSTSYIIANAVVLPIAAYISYRLGRKTYYTWCIGIFTVASLACAMAPSLGALILFRLIQGAAGRSSFANIASFDSRTISRGQKPASGVRFTA